jgi:hypothetical protein
MFNPPEVPVIYDINELPPPKRGKIRLYHAVSNARTNQILREGLLLNKIKSTDAGGVWCSTSPYYNMKRDTIILDVPLKDTWRANRDEYVVYRDIKPNDMKGVLKVYRFGNQGRALQRSDELPKFIDKHGLDFVLKKSYGKELKKDLGN